LSIANGFTYFLQDFKLQGGKVGGGSPHFLFQPPVGASVFVQAPGNLV
jgi:hypothetical protein